MIWESHIQGFNPADMDNRLIVKLFVDDTTVYLSEWDHFEDLEEILNDWCQALRVKFNIAKTEIIPIGTPEYRKCVADKYRIGPLPKETLMATNITQYGDSTCLLDVKIENKIDGQKAWSNVVTKVKTSLDRWAASRPMLKGKRLIAQLALAAQTQYLT
ncbi:hypothetical protein BDN71DRAFT_1391327 [Pleurotus eryngii]|uniref:Reverse transcriptase domain-containing protein n=1 Tax=Pleurotus eryngii TaxID=5323 RepID=A0A9P5ZWX2_PLEER|nr:hypothetical protein BDN71DRAFT_1391327 [Pleurotus eryngii]